MFQRTMFKIFTLNSKKTSVPRAQSRGIRVRS